MPREIPPTNPRDSFIFRNIIIEENQNLRTIGIVIMWHYKNSKIQCGEPTPRSWHYREIEANYLCKIGSIVDRYINNWNARVTLTILATVELTIWI